jgi:RNA polymerase sigma factor (sigma-70 family)
MRRIIIENARRRKTAKRGGARPEGEPLPGDPIAEDAGVDLLALDEALAKLCASEPVIGDLVKLRYFAGLTIDQVAQIQEISRRTVIDRWAYARSWLAREIAGGGDKPVP